MSEIYIGRQPILDKDQKVYAYELLFRKNMENRAIIDDEVQAMSRTIVNTLGNFGTEKLVGDKFGFLNVNDTFIMSESIELIPPDKFIFEILENSQVNEYFVNRVMDLKARGYKFALDDLVFDDEYMKTFGVLFDKVDIIKMDYLFIDKTELKTLFPKFQKLPVKFLAEKIEEHSDFELCRDLGFDYFQGYYFEKPEVLHEESKDPNKLSILNLIRLIYNNADIEDIENELKMNPDLSFNLLKFINSGAFFLSNTIKSVSHAITILGMNKLLNWLLLLSYADPKSGGTKNAIFQSALVRAKMMEELVKLSKEPSIKRKSDSAFFIGLLSLIDTIFHLPKEKVLIDLHLDEEIVTAVLNYTGLLGQYLELVIASENNIQVVNQLSESLKLGIQNINDAKIKTFEWVDGFS